MTEDEMVGLHHRLNGHGFGWTLGFGDGVGSLPFRVGEIRTSDVGLQSLLVDNVEMHKAVLYQRTVSLISIFFIHESRSKSSCYCFISGRC